jgi:glycosyltransferase involved in cell wall biosynthesis
MIGSSGLEETVQDQSPPGFNVIGHVSGNLGTGVTARNVVRLLLEKSYSVAIWDVDPGLNRGKHDLSFEQYAVKALNELPYAINLFVLHPPPLIELFSQNPWFILQRNRLNVGFCPWELAVLPRAWIQWLQVLDVLVAESDFIRYTFENSLSGVSTISAVHPLYLPDGIHPSRYRFGLPEDAVIFITSFEPHSDPLRKNPFAAIDAFQESFDNDERAHLVIKLNNAQADGQAHSIVSLLRSRTGDNARIHLLEATLSYYDILSLYASCDVFVSLHRSEGLGLGPMEAMALGKPVIATGWSGNMSYMDHTNSCLVSYRLIPVEGQHAVYKKDFFDVDAFWADPNIEEAAAWMKQLVDNPARRDAIGRRAATDMAGFQARARAGHFVDELFDIWGHRLFLPESDQKRLQKERLIKWWLRVADGNAADLEFCDDDPDMVRVAIKRAQSGMSYDVQLNQMRLQSKSNHHYVVRFSARADAPRSIFIGFAQAFAPWSGLGLYGQVELSTEWQTFEQSFVATQDEDAARIHFDMGNSNIPVELSSVTLRDLSEGKFVESNGWGHRLFLPESDQKRLQKERLIKWWLRVADGNAADLEFCDDDPDMVRVAIKRAQSGISYDVQLNQMRLQSKSNHHYVVRFSARADAPRSIFIGFAQAFAPWSGLGLYGQVELSTEWQTFEQSFVATQDEDAARIHFDMGNSNIPVELSSVTIRDLSEDIFVEPDLP